MDNKKVILLGCVALASGAAQLYAQQNTKPNIILIVADDHGKDALGCYGNKVIKTPNLDKLAKNGVRFSNAYCTSASSAASRSVLLSGKYGHATGAFGHVHDYHHFSTYDSIQSLPVILEEHGYKTARIGKYHVAPESVYHFDEEIKADPRNTVQMAENSKHIFDSDKPFFLYFCTDDPHRGNFTQGTGDWADPNTFGNKPEGYEGVKTIKYDPDKVIVPSFLPDNKYTREEIAEYYQSISRIDQGVGRLMKYLKESGKMDNTIVMYISDNGMAFPGAKTTVYEPGIQLPCIISSPFVEADGKWNNAMISWADMTPTILDMANIDMKGMYFHGRSFKDIIGQEEPKGWDKIYASHTFHEITMYYPMRVIENRDYKLIWNAAWQLDYPFASDLWISSTWQGVYHEKIKMYGKRTVDEFLHRPEFELFDMKNDPDESINLYDDEKYADVLKEMIEELKAWQLKTRDPWYILWDNNPAMQGSGEKL